MAREVIVKTWCDVCLDADENEEGRELPPLLLPELPGNKARVVALCDVHEKQLYTPLVDLLLEHGQMVDEEGNPTGPRGKYGKAGGGMTCPECGHQSPNRGALSSHTKNMHGKALAELLGEGTYTCPECGQKCAKPQGLAAHRRAAHGIVGASAEERAPDPELDLEEPAKAAKKAPAKRTPRPRKKA